MSIKDKIAEANKQGKRYVISDPSELVMTLPDGRSVIEIFTPGRYDEINMKTSRIIGTYRGEPAKILKPLKYVIRGGPKGGITNKGTLKANDEIFILGWPGFTDKDNCDLIVLHGDQELVAGPNTMEILGQRLVECKEGAYINLEEGVDYEYTGKAPLRADKTTESVVTVREIDYLDEIFCEGTLPAMTLVTLCTQFGETFLEREGIRIMDNPVEGVDYV